MAKYLAKNTLGSMRGTSLGDDVQKSLIMQD